MKKLIGLLRVLFGVVLLAACAESPTEPLKPKPEWVYEGQWGSKGSGNGQFKGYTNVAVAPGGNVYVADPDTHRIQYFTPTGSFLGKWGTLGTGNGEFDYPSDVAVAATGNVYVADGGDRKRVQYFTPTGSYLGQWGSPGSGNGQFKSVGDVAVASGGDVYVADASNYRIQYFTSSGSFLGKWGSYGSSSGQFWRPLGVAVAPNGVVYVTDVDVRQYFGQARVQYFTPTGSFLGKWGTWGSDDGEFTLPAGLAVAPNGHVYVSDLWLSRVQYFTSNGRFIGKLGSHSQFERPEGVALSSSGARAYVADSGHYRIQYFKRRD